jgi:hypothetical protein
MYIRLGFYPWVGIYPWSDWFLQLQNLSSARIFTASDFTPSARIFMASDFSPLAWILSLGRVVFFSSEFHPRSEFIIGSDFHSFGFYTFCTDFHSFGFFTLGSDFILGSGCFL